MARGRSMSRGRGPTYYQCDTSTGDCVEGGSSWANDFIGCSAACDIWNNDGMARKANVFVERGGTINNNRRNKMARGRRAPVRGRAPARKMNRGGRPAPRGRATARGRGNVMARGGRPAPRKMVGGGGAGRSTCNPRTGVGCGNQMGSSYKRGGRTRPVPRAGGRRMAHGGRAGGRKMPGGGNVGGYNYGNSGCQMWTGQIDCNAKPGCSWNFDDSCCH